MSPEGVLRPALPVKVVSRLGPLARAWDQLVDEQPLPSPFLKSWWIENVAVGKIEILYFLDGEDLVGGAAFEVDRMGRGRLGVERVRSVGQGVLAPDHLDVIASPERRSEVLAATLEWLHRPGSRVVDLAGVSAQGSLGRALSTHEIERISAPFASLPAEPSAYFAGLPGQMRSTIKRGRNRFAKQGVTSSRVPATDIDQIERALDSLAELHDGRWSEESSFLEAFEHFRAAALSGSANGEVLIHTLGSSETGVVAIEVDLIAGSRACFYQAGRRTEREWRGCGTVLRADLIALICDEGRTEYDMLRGNESYKADWATGERDLLRCRFGVGPGGKVLATTANTWKRSAPRLLRLRSAVRETISRAPWPRRREPRIEM
ncbi:MAG: GNAT family N-acetyltransferase [Microthrixaceae bacterium]